ncbi:MAG: M23 family metallopeptidase [Firmicutes bacterium]|nr:M23 family metallopeptidase [Bacillota bacterium]
MDVEEIIRKNKEKRMNYINSDKSSNKDDLPKNLKYIKGLISRVLLSIIFVLGSIIFTNLSDNNKKIYKEYVLENSLGFTKINNLYQSLFGEVDILSEPKDDSTSVFFNSIDYSNIENYKNGVKLTTGINEVVNVITSGIVVFIGEKDDLGNTIIIQGNDGVDIWYSNITDTNIKIYDYVESGAILGTSNSDFIYLTINKDGKYITYEEYQKLI